MIKTHTAASGSMEGLSVPCHATKKCRLQPEDDHFYYKSAEDINRWNELKIKQDIGEELSSNEKKDFARIEEYGMIASYVMSPDPKTRAQMATHPRLPEDLRQVFMNEAYMIGGYSSAVEAFSSRDDLSTKEVNALLDEGYYKGKWKTRLY